jgi:protoheme IX farnesyltransferase
VTDASPAEAPSTVRTYLELTKPRIIELLLVTTIPAMFVAANGWPGFGLILVALAGGALSAGGANVINQVYDADIDVLMARTSRRPLPTDRVSLNAAAWFGAILGVAGFLVLTIGANLLTGVLSAVAFIGYLIVYTMLLKRSTTQNIVLGGAAGAVPALIGWAAYTDSLSLTPWIMFAIIFFWTPPHFWALSLKYEDDYRAASIPMLPVVVGEAPTLANILWYSVVTAGITLLLIPVGDLGWIFAGVAIPLSGRSVVLAARLKGNRGRAIPYFLFTNLVLAGVFLAMMIDRLADTPPIGGGQAWVVAGAALVVVGLAGVVFVESRSGMRATGVSVARHTIEITITVAFALTIVTLAWRSLPT